MLLQGLLTMKKTTKPAKQLHLRTEKVRDLQTLTDAKLRAVVGGLGVTEPTGHTTSGLD